MTGMATMTIDGHRAELTFDDELRIFEGAIPLAATEEYEAGVACFSGVSVAELEANAREVLRATREAVLGQ